MKKKFFIFLSICAMCFAAFGNCAFAEDEAETATTTQTSAGELSDDLYSFQLKLDGTLYCFPMSFADFTSMGWTIDDGETDEIAPNSYSSYSFKKGSLGAYADVFNLGLNTLPVTECQIGGMSIDYYQFENAPETVIEFPKGILYHVSTLDDIKAAYGEASDIYEGDSYTELTYDYDSYQNIELYIDKETGLFDEFDIQNMTADDEANAAAAAEVSGEPTPEVLAYETPAELGDDIRSGIVEFAGNLYQLPAPVSVFLENGFILKPEESDPIVAGEYFGWFEMLKDGKEFRGTARNYSANATTIENCFVTEVECDSYSADFPLTLPGGITSHMDADELLQALADLPYEVSNESDDYIYYTVREQDNYDWSINIVVEKEGNTVTSIEFENR